MSDGRVRGDDVSLFNDFENGVDGFRRFLELLLRQRFLKPLDIVFDSRGTMLLDPAGKLRLHPLDFLLQAHGRHHGNGDRRFVQLFPAQEFSLPRECFFALGNLSERIAFFAIAPTKDRHEHGTMIEQITKITFHVHAIP
jgi:hypothetical protein